MDAEAGEDALEVAAPADRDRHRADGVLENQVPADHPGEDLAERGVGVGVGAAGDRDHRRELGVAQRREAAGEAGRHVGEHDRRPRLVGGRRPGQHEDAGADDRADAQQRQIHGRQRALERLAPVLDVADQLLDRLRLQQIRIHSPSRGLSVQQRKGAACRCRRTMPGAGNGAKIAALYMNEFDELRGLRRSGSLVARRR